MKSRLQESHAMKTIAIVSQKGGSGKTTLALNLGVAAHLDGKSVVIADLDEQASATMWHQARKDPLPHVQPTHSAALPSVMAEAEKQGVDYFIIDTAPQSDRPAINAAEAADIILITCKPSVMDLRAVQNTVRLIKIANLKPETQVFMLLTMVEHFSQREREEAAAILRELSMNVLPCWMGLRVAYRHSLINGEGVLEYEHAGKAAEEISTIYKQLKSKGLKKARLQEVKTA